LFRSTLCCALIAKRYVELHYPDSIWAGQCDAHISALLNLLDALEGRLEKKDISLDSLSLQVEALRPVQEQLVYHCVKIQWLNKFGWRAN